MAIATGIDASYAGPTIDYGAVRAAGYSLVARYLGSDDRCLTAPERDRIYAAGLRLAVIGQRGAVDRPRAGRTQGHADGSFFDSWADRLDIPKTTPILCAIGDVGDPDGPGPKSPFPLESDLPAIDQFLQGLWESTNRPVGIYGPYWVLEHFRGDHRVFCFWQSAGGSGSGSGTGGRIFNAGDSSWRRLSSLACMYQEYGHVVIGGTDHNAVLMPFEAFTHHPTDTTAPVATRRRDTDMPFTVKCPNRTGDAIWIALPDLRRIPGDNPVQTGAVDKASGGDAYVELHDDEADEFLRTYFPTDLATVHWGPVRLMVDGAARAAAAVLEALPEATPIDITALAADIAAKLATQLEVAGESITIDQLVGRIANELSARLAQ